MNEMLVRVENLTRTFRVRGSRDVVRAVDGVDFDITAGETLALVGESGCGKSTTARLVARLIHPTAGRVYYDGHDVTRMGGRSLRRRRHRVQIVFQDPFSSLDPRMTSHDVVAEPLRVQGRYGPAERRRVDELLEQVGLDPALGGRLPTKLSGGQRQRIGIARALALRPEVIVLDEPVSALDASIQAQVLNLLTDIQRETGVSYLFISHDLSVVRHLADRVMVMYLGRIVEAGTAAQLFGQPSHPYTQGLLSAVPLEHPALRAARPVRLSRGEPADPSSPPSGCPYHPRCHRAEAVCSTTRPQPPDRATGVACLFPHPQPLELIRTGHPQKEDECTATS